MQQVTNNYFEARVSAKLDRTQAALELGIATAELLAIESGRKEPDALLVARMASLYHASSDWLIGLMDERPG